MYIYIFCYNIKGVYLHSFSRLKFANQEEILPQQNCKNLCINKLILTLYPSNNLISVSDK